MSLSRTGITSLAILALAACGCAFAGVGEPSAQTLCNAIGSEISVPGEAEATTAAATKPKTRATQSVKPAARAPGAAGGGTSRGGGGDAALERRGRWKSFLPGTFK